MKRLYVIRAAARRSASKSARAVSAASADNPGYRQYCGRVGVNTLEGSPKQSIDRPYHVGSSSYGDIRGWLCLQSKRCLTAAKQVQHHRHLCWCADQSLRAMREHGVTGIITSPVHGTDLNTIKSTIPNRFPTAMALRSVEGSLLPFVGQNNFEGAKLTIQNLIELGQKQIAFVGRDSTFPAQRERVAGWAHALWSVGVNHTPYSDHRHAVLSRWGRLCCAIDTGLLPRPTAIICYNGFVARGLSAALADGGVVVLSAIMKPLRTKLFEVAAALNPAIQEGRSMLDGQVELI